MAFTDPRAGFRLRSDSEDFQEIQLYSSEPGAVEEWATKLSISCGQGERYEKALALEHRFDHKFPVDTVLGTLHEAGR